MLVETLSPSHHPIPHHPLPSRPRPDRVTDRKLSQKSISSRDRAGRPRTRRRTPGGGGRGRGPESRAGPPGRCSCRGATLAPLTPARLVRRGFVRAAVANGQVAPEGAPFVLELVLAQRHRLRDEEFVSARGWGSCDCLQPSDSRLQRPFFAFCTCPLPFTIRAAGTKGKVAARAEGVQPQARVGKAFCRLR